MPIVPNMIRTQRIWPILHYLKVELCIDLTHERIFYHCHYYYYYFVAIHPIGIYIGKLERTEPNLIHFKRGSRVNRHSLFSALTFFWSEIHGFQDWSIEAKLQHISLKIKYIFRLEALDELPIALFILVFQFSYFFINQIKMLQLKRKGGTRFFSKFIITMFLVDHFILFRPILKLN